MRIIKHCQEEGAGGSDLVQGVLMGLVEKNRLEVTNCFPFPRNTDEEEFDEGGSIEPCLYFSVSLNQCVKICYAVMVAERQSSDNS